ncbi:hypothetical protein GQ600_5405 [Phytophthora cactorum]|nr:hypothetical protein GQ600_5405 [Phytophthora cactorum]
MSRLVEWVTEMRHNRSRCVTTECLLIMGGRFEPRLISERTERAAVGYLRRFRFRNRLSIRRITHRGPKHRSDLEVQFQILCSKSFFLITFSYS